MIECVVSGSMRVHLHDFSGHPFQAQLSRNLAARGHDVLHTYSSQYVTGHGRLDVAPGDPEGLRFEGLTADRPMIKYSPVGRTRFEVSYATAWQRQLEREPCDLVVACNIPLFALERMRHYFARRNQPWVMWHQDIYSLGVAAEAARKLPKPAAALVRRGVERMERAQVEAARAVVAIGEGFRDKYEEWGVRQEAVHVIPNWAPLDELVPGQRDNSWACRHNLPTEPIRLMYAGTLGRKHNPLLLLELLDAARNRGVDACLIVISEGVGADDLAAAAGSRPDVRILGYQPAEELSDVLASADVMVALLEPDAAQFSIPSKVHSYLCAGRPTIALVPEGNPAAAAVTKAGGFVATPTPEGAAAAAGWLGVLADDRGALTELGGLARALAEAEFDIDRIGAQFDEILRAAAYRGPARARRITGEANTGGGLAA